MKYILGFLFIFVFFFAKISFAQDTGWIINTYESKINVNQNGEVEVTENLQVDFYSLEKHGIFRDIPYIYSKNSGRHYTYVKIISVTRNGSQEKYSSYKSGNNIKIKVGDPNRTIFGKQNYSIKYIVQGVILPYENFDELYWNATGVWPVPVEFARAIVSLPSDSMIQASCYFGYEGYQNECESIISSKTAVFSSSNLAPSEQMTIAVGFKKNTVPILTVSPPKSVFEQIKEPFNIFLFIMPVIVGFAFILHHWYRNGRDLWFRRKNLFNVNTKEEIKPLGYKDTIVVEYTPPENLRPAEIGVLMDEKADTLDVAATIIDLASRGYFKIIEIPKKWVFGNIDYELIRSSKDTSELLRYESMLLEKLFSGKKIVKISELKNKFYTNLSKVKKELYSHVVEKKFFPIDPEKVRGKYILIAITIFFICIFGVSFIHLLPLQMLLGGCVLFSVLLIIFSRSMPRRTGYGQELYRRVKGYYEFISKVEKYKQQFFEKKNMLNEILPYAIVFGLTGKFAQALKDMDVKPDQPSWYAGHTAFNIANFEKNINTFSSSLSTAISSAPRSSGSSGGGSSGGGFGGGRGGSW